MRKTVTSMTVTQKMLKLSIICLLCIISAPAEEEYYNLAAQRFCKRTCFLWDSFKQNAGCGCEKRQNPEITIIDNDKNKFRAAIVLMINEFRQSVASGQTHLPKAANMMIVNYDVGLEYLATCIMKRGANGGQPCARDKYVVDVMPSGSFISLTKKDTMDIRNVKTAVDHYHKFLVDHSKEIKPEEVDNNQMLRGNKLLAGVAMMDTNAKVGCGRAENLKSRDPSVRKLVFCLFSNYVGTDLHYMAHFRVYKRGEPCSQCPPLWIRCNDQYTALCGTLEPVPTYGWRMGPVVYEPWLTDNNDIVRSSRSHKFEHSKKIIVALLTALFLFK